MRVSEGGKSAAPSTTTVSRVIYLLFSIGFAYTFIQHLCLVTARIFSECCTLRSISKSYVLLKNSDLLYRTQTGLLLYIFSGCWFFFFLLLERLSFNTRDWACDLIRWFYFSESLISNCIWGFVNALTNSAPCAVCDVCVWDSAQVMYWTSTYGGPTFNVNYCIMSFVYLLPCML